MKHLPSNEHCQMTYEEVARLLGMTKQGVAFHEKNALRKMRRHPVMRQLAMDEGWKEAEVKHE